LEKVKHLFNVPNIAFVLAVDKDQLGHSIKSMYGEGMDTGGYLRRFIDLDFSLPIPDTARFCDAQFAKFGLVEIFSKRTGDLVRNDTVNLNAAFTAFFKGLSCSVRDQEHCFTLLSLALRTTKENYQIFPFLLSVLIVLKIKNPQLYSEFVTGKVDYRNVIDYIGSTHTGKKFLEDNYGLALEIQLAACPKETRIDEIIQRYDELSKNTTLDAVTRTRAANIHEMLTKYSHTWFRGVEGCLGYVVQKIDLVSQFES
jgi:hypothetical protein